MSSRCAQVIAAAMLVVPAAGLTLWGHGCGGVPGSADAGVDAPSNDTTNDVVVEAADPDVIFDWSRLRLWLDADYAPSLVLGDGGGVEEWRDRSGRAPARAVHPDSAPDASMLVEMGIANGHAAIRLGGQLGFFEQGNSHPRRPFIVAVVAAYSNPTSRPALLFGHAPEFQPSPYVTDRLSLYGNDPYGSSSSVVAEFCAINPDWRLASKGAGWNDGRFHVFGMRGGEVGDDTYHVRVDGREETRLSPKPCFEVGDSITIGGDYPRREDAGLVIDYALDGYVAEVVVAVASDPPDPIEIARLSAYFQKKYGVPF